jgi:hypothetical protein
MAVRTPVLLNNGQTVVGDPTVVYQWQGLTFSGLDTGAPIGGMGWSDRSAQLAGTAGVGLNVVIEGSNDGTNWVTLKDPFANPITFTTAGLSQVTEISQFIRPRVAGGDGTTNVNVTIVMSTQRL